MLPILYDASEKLGLIAIWTYDQDADGKPGMPRQISSLLFGSSSDEILEKETALAALNFY